MTAARLALCLLAATSLAACHRRAEGPATLTADEQAQLNDAAAALDAQSANGAGVDGADLARDGADNGADDPADNQDDPS